MRRRTRRPRSSPTRSRDAQDHSRCRRQACARATSCSSKRATIIPCDGEVIEGVASVDESAITGESAPVIREGGGDRSAVTGGTRVLSDWLVVRVTANPGETFLDRMIAMVEGAKRQKTPNEIALDILLAALTIIFLLATVTLLPFSHLQREGGGRRAAGHDHRAGRAAGVPDSDDDRRAALGHRHRRHGSDDPGERDRDVRPRGRSGGRRRRAAARQDRHDHARQSPGGRSFIPRPASPSTSWPTRRSWRRSPTKRPKAAASSCWRRRSTVFASANMRELGAPFRSVHRADAHERRRHRRSTSFAKARPTRSSSSSNAQGGSIPAGRARDGRTRSSKQGGTPLVVADGGERRSA